MPKPEQLTAMQRHAVASIRRATGRRYGKLEEAVESMEHFATQDLVRLIRDLQQNAQAEKNKRRRGQYWG